MRTIKQVALGMALAAASITVPVGRAAAPAQLDQSAEACPVPKVVVPRPADPAKWPAWVDARVAELQPTAQERKLDRIGWAGSILEAEALARRSNRPVFLFTLDGRMNTGRC